MPVSTSNQLGTGTRTPAPQPMRTTAPARETWEEETWQEERRPIREPLRQREPEPVYYDDEEGNWDDEAPEQYAQVYEEEEIYEAETVDELEDVWEDDENPKPYRAPQVNIPERKKVVEYEEEEADY